MSDKQVPAVETVRVVEQMMTEGHAIHARMHAMGHQVPKNSKPRFIGLLSAGLVLGGAYMFVTWGNGANLLQASASANDSVFSAQTNVTVSSIKDYSHIDRYQKMEAESKVKHITHKSELGQWVSHELNSLNKKNQANCDSSSTINSGFMTDKEDLSVPVCKIIKASKDRPQHIWEFAIVRDDANKLFVWVGLFRKESDKWNYVTIGEFDDDKGNGDLAVIPGQKTVGHGSVQYSLGADLNEMKDRQYGKNTEWQSY